MSAFIPPGHPASQGRLSLNDLRRTEKGQVFLDLEVEDWEELWQVLEKACEGDASQGRREGNLAGDVKTRYL